MRTKMKSCRPVSTIAKLMGRIGGLSSTALMICARADAEAIARGAVPIDELDEATRTVIFGPPQYRDTEE